MKFLLRVVGTWLLGLALVLLVIDGTRSLAANGILLTSVIDMVAMLLPDVALAIADWVTAALDPSGVGDMARAVLGWPAIAIAVVLGLLCLFVGRRKSRQHYLETL